MNRLIISLIVALILLVQCCSSIAQESAAPANDSKPAVTNAPGQQYPRVDSQSRVIFSVRAPRADKVQVLFSNPLDPQTPFDLTDPGGTGTSTLTSPPLQPGFHYYQLVIDGVAGPDPASLPFYGNNIIKSGVEVPVAGGAYYDLKPVPHGDVHTRYYLSKSTGGTRRAFVYTPPNYEEKSNARFPVVYLQHGSGGDETQWALQGRANFILDNLIAEGKAKPMIVVMENGGIGAGARGGRGRGARADGDGGDATRGNTLASTEFTRLIISDVIPMIDASYRTLPDRDHRAMAGLSAGGSQTYQITQANLDKFAYVGTFSGAGSYPSMATGYNGLLAKPAEFAKQVKVLYVSLGSAEGDNFGRSFHQALDGAGVKHVYYESPETGHDWQTWRNSFYGLAPLLFQD